MEKKLLKNMIVNIFIITLILTAIFSVSLIRHGENTAENNMDHMLNQLNAVYSEAEDQVYEKIDLYVNDSLAQLDMLDYILRTNPEKCSSEGFDEILDNLNISDIYMISESGEITLSSNEQTVGTKIAKTDSSQPAWDLIRNPDDYAKAVMLDNEQMISGVTSQNFFAGKSSLDEHTLLMVGVNASILDDMKQPISIERFIEEMPTERNTCFMILDRKNGKILGVTRTDQHLADMTQISDEKILHTLLQTTEGTKSIRLNGYKLFARSTVFDDLLLVCLTETDELRSSILIQILLCGILFVCTSLALIILIKRHFHKYVFDEFKMIENTVAAVISGRKDIEFHTKNNTEIRQLVDILNSWKTNFNSQEEQISDISQKLEHIVTVSEHDSLTGILNRSAFAKYTKASLLGNPSGGVFLIFDLDNFKTLNDTLGHPEGDRALKMTARYLRSGFRETDIIARLGGDEFAVFMKGSKKTDRKLLESKLSGVMIDFQRTIPESYKKCRLSISIGAAFADCSGTDYDSLYKRADDALYQAKKDGKGRYVILSASGTHPES